MASGDIAFGAAADFSNINSEKTSTFNPDRNTKSVFVEEVALTETLQTSPEEEIAFIGFGNSVINQESLSLKVDGFVNCLSSLQDKRKLLGQTIFPYHFFW
ncbi:hypothetical protein BXY75_0332 [Ulvibacter antarcticus]|uniref:Uncharacterized protein n=1 Tax=Ulvibacter antarcticus TaxID=442714 RepID=A0A3L9YZ39_9FLAO|nr:hypothetical protein BXY75_0332 [Ulvibacter antarcticus]